jgi:hypothetical protein
VSPMVITHLRLALTWESFSSVLGPALLSKKGESLRFDLTRFPSDWTKYAASPKSKNKNSSLPSKKRDVGIPVTKSTITKSRRFSREDENSK